MTVRVEKCLPSWNQTSSDAEPGASLARPRRGAVRPNITSRRVSNTQCVRDSSSRQAISFPYFETPGRKRSGSSGAYSPALDSCTEGGEDDTSGNFGDDFGCALLARPGAGRKARPQVGSQGCRGALSAFE